MALIFFFPAAGSPSCAGGKSFFYHSELEGKWLYPLFFVLLSTMRVFPSPLQSLPASVPSRDRVRRAGPGAHAGTGVEGCSCRLPAPAQDQPGCQLFACCFFPQSIFCQLLGLCLHALFLLRQNLVLLSNSRHVSPPLGSPP